MRWRIFYALCPELLCAFSVMRSAHQTMRCPGGGPGPTAGRRDWQGGRGERGRLSALRVRVCYLRPGGFLLVLSHLVAHLLLPDASPPPRGPRKTMPRTRQMKPVHDTRGKSAPRKHDDDFMYETKGPFRTSSEDENPKASPARSDWTCSEGAWTPAAAACLTPKEGQWTT